jgi:hypothetical protein
VAAGIITPPGRIDEQLTNLAVRMRNLMQEVSNLSTQVTGTQPGLQFLSSINYDPNNAPDALTKLSYLNTIAGCYYGNVRQGGDGTAGSAILFAFHNALSSLWNGQTD